MNKLIITLAALAALSTASLAAGNRSYDLTDTEYWASNGVATATGSADVYQSEGLAIGTVVGESAFERMNRLSYENDHGRH